MSFRLEMNRQSDRNTKWLLLLTDNRGTAGSGRSLAERHTETEPWTVQRTVRNWLTDEFASSAAHAGGDPSLILCKTKQKEKEDSTVNRSREVSATVGKRLAWRRRWRGGHKRPRFVPLTLLLRNNILTGLCKQTASAPAPLPRETQQNASVERGRRSAARARLSHVFVAESTGRFLWDEAGFPVCPHCVRTLL